MKYGLTCALVAVLVLSATTSALDVHLHDRWSQETKALVEDAVTLIEEVASEENSGDVLKAVVYSLRLYLFYRRSEMGQNSETDVGEATNIDKRVPEYKKRIPEYKKRVPEYKKRVPEY